MSKWHRLVCIIDPPGDYHYYESGFPSASALLTKFFQSSFRLDALYPYLKPISGVRYSEIFQNYESLWDVSIDMQNHEIIITDMGYTIQFYYS